MATILLIEDQPDLGLYEAQLLERAGHRIVRCNGGPSMSAACPLLKSGRCALVEQAELIVFSIPMFAIKGRTYRGVHLLRAYRAHPDYGRLPMVVVSLGTPPDLPGRGPLIAVDKFSDPHVVITAVASLLQGSTNDHAPMGTAEERS